MDGSVGDRGEGFVVGDDDEGLAETVAEIEEELVQLLLVFAVETARGFVGKDDGGIVDEGTGHSHALFLSAGEFVGLVVGPLGEIHELEQFFGAPLSLAMGCAGNVGWNHDVLDGRELGQQLVELEYETEMTVAEVGQFLLREGSGVDAVDTYGAAVGPVEGADDLQQGGLAGSTGADNADNFAFGDVQVNAFEYLQGAEALGDILDGNHFFRLRIEN